MFDSSRIQIKYTKIALHKVKTKHFINLHSLFALATREVVQAVVAASSVHVD